MIWAAVGMFDGVHLGHQALVRSVASQAHEHGAQAAVFTFRNHPLELVAPDKAPRLLTSLADKQSLLLAAGADKVVVLDFDEKLRLLTARDFMAMLRDDYGVSHLVMGFNHRFGHDRLASISDYRQIGESLGVDVLQSSEMRLPGFEQGVSSSEIRKALMRGDTASAAAMLGRPYAFAGTVAHGQGIGRTIGFPTANIEPLCPRQLVPASGVYAADIEIDGKDYPAMVNIGSRPTIAYGLKETIEAHAIGYDGDLYGAQTRLAFRRRLRDERKFPSLAALQAQLALDLAAALS